MTRAAVHIAEPAIVVIGRNEGERLRRCLASVRGAGLVVYVDSGSSDGSAQWAREAGFDVVELDCAKPFTAARARNAGFAHAMRQNPPPAFVQFVDGDTEIAPGWIAAAAEFLASRPDVGVVCGHLREREPERSIYNWLCDREWAGPDGDIRACGGIAMMRADALAGVGGFRENLIAGEEPELCHRIRAANRTIWRLKIEMGIHDAAIMRFGQWWSRAVRGGMATLQATALARQGGDRRSLWLLLRTGIWAVALPIACLMLTALFWPQGAISWLVFPLQMIRQMVREHGSLSERAFVAGFQMLSRFAEAIAAFRHVKLLITREPHTIVEYK